VKHQQNKEAPSVGEVLQRRPETAPFFGLVRSGSIQPTLPSGRRYTTDKPPWAAFLNTIV
jgi:hypothetical protein